MKVIYKGELKEYYVILEGKTYKLIKGKKINIPDNLKSYFENSRIYEIATENKIENKKDTTIRKYRKKKEKGV